ncbi:hypothetical protein FOZ62_008677, partial [Perkinsus olseni]
DISRLELFAIVLGLLIVGEIQDESEGECTILSDNTAAIHVRAFHVSGVSNEISDDLSRGVRPRQRVARALGRRVPVSKFIERLLGASGAFYGSSHRRQGRPGAGVEMPEDLWGCVESFGAGRGFGGVRPAVKSGGVLRSSFTHPRHRNGSGSEPYALRPSVRIVGSKSRGIPTVSTDTMSMVLAAARAPSTNRKYTCIERRYMDLMVRMNIPPWPLSGYSLVAYVSALVREGRVKAETVVDYVGKLQCSNRRFAEDISGPAKEM